MINSKKKIKLLFIQLPLIDHGYNYIDGNIFTAPSSIAAYISKNFKNYIEDLYVIPSDIQNFASNKIIAQIAVKYEPDLILFSNYLWNAERHISLAGLIKKKIKTKIIFGGPEISENSYILSKNHKSVDLFVKGEGEFFFNKYFTGEYKKNLQNINDNLLFIQREKELLSPSEIVEPYSSGYLNRSNDQSVFIEITRGCYYKCSYCNYSRFGKKVRELPSSILLESLRNKKRPLKEVYILSPSFGNRKDYRNILEELSKLKPKVSIHTELRTENITKEDALLLKKAGVNSLEVGIQTFTENALKQAGRHSEKKKALEGLKNLRSAGISLKIGMIPGLPGDSILSFMQGVAELVKEGFAEEIEFYPLMVLPGTAVRDFCDAKGYKYMKKPPYYFLKGGDFREEDIFAAKQEIENITGFEVSSKKIPDFTSDENAIFVKGIKTDSAKIGHVLKKKDFIDTNVFSFQINIIKKSDSQKILSLFSEYETEWELLNIIFTGDFLIKENPVLFAEKEHFFKRMHYYDSTSTGRKKQYYHITENIDFYEEISANYFLIEPLLKLSQKNISYIANSENPVLVLSTKGVYSRNRKLVSEKYAEYYDYISFEDKNEMKMFYSDIGKEISEYYFRSRFISV
ncbi:MAG TPA: radical SAM protein [Spirochaetota bacterium]|nr:radical SAM protein [Spirochaetota bacterium]